MARSGDGPARRLAPTAIGMFKQDGRPPKRPAPRPPPAHLPAGPCIFDRLSAEVGRTCKQRQQQSLDGARPSGRHGWPAIDGTAERGAGAQESGEWSARTLRLLSIQRYSERLLVVRARSVAFAAWPGNARNTSIDAGCECTKGWDGWWCAEWVSPPAVTVRGRRCLHYPSMPQGA